MLTCCHLISDNRNKNVINNYNSKASIKLIKYFSVKKMTWISGAYNKKTMFNWQNTAFRQGETQHLHSVHNWTWTWEFPLDFQKNCNVLNSQWNT